MELAAANDTVIAPANSIDDLLTDAHLVAREALVEYTHPTGGPVWVTGNPIKVQGEHYTVRRHAPALGEHTDEYLTSLGYGADQLAAWREKGIV
jgi:crotonobetainyl-CoA:carnitine CoA-transferase CaiB-like acyl-CoA transferase